MRILHSKKIVFVSKPRCGSTSIRRILDDYMVTGDERCDQAGDFDDLHPHMTAPAIRAYLTASGKNPEEYIFFTVTRNPLEMLWSCYKYFEPDMKGKYNFHKLHSKNLMNFQNWLMNGKMGLGRTWKDYVPKEVSANDLTPLSLEAFILNKDGDVVIDKVWKMESRPEMLLWLSQLLGRNVKDKELNKSKDLKAPEFSKKMLSRVHKMFPRECSLYNIGLEGKDEEMSSRWRASFPDDWYSRFIIYDVGMNTGQDTAFYLKKGFHVIAIEADPQLCLRAHKKFRPYVKSGQLIILNVGISNESGRLDFYINRAKSEWSSFHKQIAGRDGNKLTIVDVEVDTLNSIILEYGIPYYLKIDIEGNDAVALNSALKGDYSIPYISVENGGKLLKLLKHNSYNAFKYIQQNNVHHQSQAKPVLEGKPIRHKFEFGASGKFAEETDGEWLTFEEVYNDVNNVWDVESGKKNINWNDSTDGWFDLHARHKNIKEVLEEMLVSKKQ